jgi:cytochrome c553
VLRLILIAILALIAALAIAAYFLRPEPPMMPRDPDHLARQTEKQCLACHGPGQQRPRKPTHPNANDCSRCHNMKPAT